jgi:hypothetical protein
MVVLGGIVGAIVGFAAGVAITEFIFSNPPSGTSGMGDWQLIVDIACLVAGALAGSSIARHFAARRNVKLS